MIQKKHQVRRGESQLLATSTGDTVMRAKRRRIRHRITCAINDMEPVPTPPVGAIATIIVLVQVSPRLIDQAAMNPPDQFDRQPIPRLTPGDVGERLAGQVMHRGTSDIAVSDLPNEPTERVAGCEDRVAEGMILCASQLIDASWNKQLRRSIPHARQSQIKASHPWPPVEE